MSYYLVKKFLFSYINSLEKKQGCIFCMGYPAEGVGGGVIVYCVYIIMLNSLLDGKTFAWKS